VFDDCTNLTSITVDINNANYSSLDGVLFNKNKTTLILFPVGKGGSYTTIPNSVTSIGYRAFQFCTNLTSIVIPDSVTSIGVYAFISCTNLTYVVIPNSVTSIGDSAFGVCTNLTSVVIPNSVTRIGDYAFDRCTALTSIAIPHSVTSIGSNAFLNSGLATVTIASGQLGIPSPASGVAFFGRTVATVPF
jgi:hypothetical protein